MLLKRVKKTFYKVLIINIVLQIILCVGTLILMRYLMLNDPIEKETLPSYLSHPILGLFIGFPCGGAILVLACFQAWRFDIQKRKQ